MVSQSVHGVAGLSVLCARYLFFSTGEVSIVAIVAMAPPGVGLLDVCDTKSWVAISIGVVVCTVWLAIENPYLRRFYPC